MALFDNVDDYILFHQKLSELPIHDDIKKQFKKWCKKAKETSKKSSLVKLDMFVYLITKNYPQIFTFTHEQENYFLDFFNTKTSHESSSVPQIKKDMLVSAARSKLNRVLYNEDGSFVVDLDEPYDDYHGFDTLRDAFVISALQFSNEELLKDNRLLPTKDYLDKQCDFWGKIVTKRHLYLMEFAYKQYHFESVLLIKLFPPEFWNEQYPNEPEGWTNRHFLALEAVRKHNYQILDNIYLFPLSFWNEQCPSKREGVTNRFMLMHEVFTHKNCHLYKQIFQFFEEDRDEATRFWGKADINGKSTFYDSVYKNWLEGKLFGINSESIKAATWKRINNYLEQHVKDFMNQDELKQLLQTGLDEWSTETDILQITLHYDEVLYLSEETQYYGVLELTQCLDQQLGASPYTRRPICPNHIELGLLPMDLEKLINQSINNFLKVQKENKLNIHQNGFFNSENKSNDDGDTNNRHSPPYTK